MAAASGLSAYLDIGDYTRAATNQEVASLLGLNTTLAASVAAGAQTLPVGASAGWAAGPLWLLDGPTSEVVHVTGAPDGATLTLAAPGLAFGHGAGVSASQAGPGGSLAETLLRASAWIESYCRQGVPDDRSLFAVPRVERFSVPSAHAWLEPDGLLVIRPGRFPVRTVAALTVERVPGAALTLDASSIETPSGGRLIEVPPAAWGGATDAPWPARGRRMWLTLSYTAGPALAGAVSYDLRQACVWVASDFLAQRRNPTGAAAVRMGRFETQQRPRADPTADSILLAQAKAALQPWRVEQ